MVFFVSNFVLHPVFNQLPIFKYYLKNSNYGFFYSMQAELISHFQHGGFYPIGGASEIAFNMIPVIERTGGKVLVKAEVQEILHNGMSYIFKNSDNTSQVYDCYS